MAQNTGTYNFGYQQGFLTGTLFNFTFNNSRQTTNNERSNYSPELQSLFQARATQHLLQGFGMGLNRRLMVQARNNRRITDSSFRQQILFTVNQVENIYWGLVSAYEDEQAKERALTQSTQLTSDNRKQLEIGTPAPLDVVNSDSAVATDKQALAASQTNLEFQQLLMKQAIARNLNDPQLSTAPVIPTDRVALDRLPEEDLPVEDLVRQAYQKQSSDRTGRAAEHEQQRDHDQGLQEWPAADSGCVCVLRWFGFLGGAQNPTLQCTQKMQLARRLFHMPAEHRDTNRAWGDVFANTFNNSFSGQGCWREHQYPAEEPDCAGRSGAVRRWSTGQVSGCGCSSFIRRPESTSSMDSLR